MLVKGKKSWMIVEDEDEDEGALKRWRCAVGIAQAIYGFR